MKNKLSPKKDTLVILNPAAQGGKAGNLKSLLQKTCFGADIQITSKAGDAQKIAAEGSLFFQKIVAAGGDGTLNEVVNGIAGSNAQLGVLPIGTMNVFATEMGIPNRLEDAWKIVQHHTTRQIDLPTANGKYFLQLAGAGLDAEVVRQTPRKLKKTIGPLAYALTLVQVLSKPAPKISLVRADGKKTSGCFALLGNGKMYGGPFPIFEKASYEDKLLDVLVFKNQSHWDIVRYLQALLTRTHLSLRDVEYFQTPSLSIKSAKPTTVELDGEEAGSLPCQFSISNQTLQVLSPDKPLKEPGGPRFLSP